MHRRRVVSRWFAAAVVALLVAATAPSALATPAAPGQARAAEATTAGSTTRQNLLSQLKLRPRAGGTRRSINVRDLAQRKPTVRPTGNLGHLTRPGHAVPMAPPAGKTPLVVTPTPTVATMNGDGTAAQTAFDGLSQSSGPLTSVAPPDPWIAVGPEHIVQAVNLTLRFTDRQGSNASSISLPDFFNLPTSPVTFDSDPHVIYDSLHGRWLATEVSWDCQTGGGVLVGNGYIDYAVSRTSDPTGVWDLGLVYFPDILPDFPAPGTSTDKVAFASNWFAMTACSASPTTTFDTTGIDYIDWADLLPGTSPSILEVSFDDAAFTARVAVQTPATSSALQHVLIDDPGDGTQEIVYFTMDGSVEDGTLAPGAFGDLTFDGVVSPALDPPPPNQPGGDTIDSAVDSRPTDAVWQGDRLVFVSTYPCGTGPRDCVRVTELDTLGASLTVDPSLTQDFLVAEGGKDLFMGGIGLTGNGTLHVAWTRSSGSGGDFPSSYTAHQARGDAVGSISAPELLAAGTGAYAGERWGDYVGVAQDPQVPSQVWNANEYSGGSEWRTKVTPLRTAGTTYVPIAPLRVLDTRPGGIGLSGQFVSGTARSWQVNGVGTIPMGAVAVTGNLTVVGQGARGYVSVTVDPTNNPPSSTINFPATGTRANNVTIPLSASGKLSAVFKGAAGKKTHLVCDITGYFLADDSGAFFNQVTPTRVLDTRIGTGLPGKFVSGTPRTLVIGGVGAIPTTATAITGNLTIVHPTKAGYVAVTKDPTPTPTTSTINFSTGAVQANGVFAPLDAGHALSIVFNSSSPGTVDILLDITGYFDPTSGGLHFVPLNPSRILDSRPAAVLSGLTGKFLSGIPQTLSVQGHWGVPTDATVVTGNLTVSGQTSAGYVAVTPDPTPTPSTSSINFPFGDTIANGIVAPLSAGASSFVYRTSAAGKTTDLILDLSGYFKP